jgi:hypothetical protein
MTYVEFFGGSYFLAWCSLWLFWMIVPIASLIFNLVNRILRSINIALRGWPPEHLDADGDFLKLEAADGS